MGARGGVVFVCMRVHECVCVCGGGGGLLVCLFVCVGGGVTVKSSWRGDDMWLKGISNDQLNVAWRT